MDSRIAHNTDKYAHIYTHLLDIQGYADIQTICFWRYFQFDVQYELSQRFRLKFLLCGRWITSSRANKYLRSQYV